MEGSGDRVKMGGRKFNISTCKEPQGPYALKAQPRALASYKGLQRKPRNNALFSVEDDRSGSLFGSSESFRKLF